MATRDFDEHPEEDTLPPREPVREDATLPPGANAATDSSEEATIVPDRSAGATDVASAGDRIRYFGEYELIDEIARGGMGVVFKARQVKLNRVVALKMILSGEIAGEEEIQRFQTEAEAAANLDHPGIVPIFEIGEHGGQHYFSMGFVDGQSLADRVKDGPLPSREAAEITRKTAEAVAYAHGNGVIHRDLKPANVLLDASGEPKVTDFGLAKKVEGDSNLTQSGAVMGTPSYMPPEQAAGKTEDVGPLADVYSLGAVLYCLLTGRPPFQASSPLDTLMQVLEQEPVAPAKMNPGLDEDLQTICLKCLEKEPGRRYVSAQELVEELGRYLRGEPIVARPISRIERAWRWCKRKPSLAGLLAVAAVLLVVLSIGGPLVALQQAEFARRQVELKTDAIEARNDADSRRTEAEAARAVAVAAKGELADQKDQAVADLYATTVALAYQEWLSNNVPRAEQLLNECPDEFRHWEWRYVKALCNSNVLTVRGHTGLVKQVVYRDSDILTVGRDTTVGLWDAQTARELRRRAIGENDLIAISPGTDLLGVVRGATVGLLDNSSGRFIHRLTVPDTMVVGAAISPDGRRAATARLTTDLVALDQDDVRSTVRIYDLESGDVIASFQAAKTPALQLAFSHDSRRLAVAGLDAVVTIFETEDGTEVARLSGHLLAVSSVDFSPDGGRVCSAGADGMAKIWDVETGQEIATLRGHNGPVHSIRFSPDGRHVVTGAEDRSVRIWNAETGEQLETLRGSPDVVVSVAYNEDGTRVAAASVSSVKVFDVSRIKTFADEIPETLVSRFAKDEAKLSDTRRQLAGYYSSHLSQRFDTVVGNSGPMQDVAFSDDGRLIGTISRGGNVVIWDAATGEEVRRMPEPAGLGFSLDFSPNSEFLAGAWGSEFGPEAENGFSGEIKIWKVETGEEVFTLKGHRSLILALAFSPDGKRLASSCGIPAAFSGNLKMLERIVGEARLERNDIRVWSVETGEQLLEFGTNPRAIVDLSFSPDGLRLASTAEDATVRIWDSRTGDELRSWVPTLAGYAAAIAFSPDRDQLATACSDRKVRVYNATSGELLQTLESHSAPVLGLAYSADGRRLISSSQDSTIRIWDPIEGRELLTLRGHANGVQGVAISPDASRLASVSYDSTLKVWNAEPAVGAVAEQEWQAVVSDDFERDALGDDWSVGGGSWEVTDGRVIATESASITFGVNMTLATLSHANLVLPDVAELTFDVRSPVNNGLQIIFANRESQGEIIEWLGVANPWSGNTGVLLQEMNGAMRFNPLTSNSGVLFEGETDYTVRVLRTPDSISLSVNGHEVCSARQTTTELAGLAINAIYGPDGSNVELDNLVVRAPQSAIDRQTGRLLARQLLDDVLLKDEVRTRLQNNDLLSDTVRDAALATLPTLSEDAGELNAASRRTSRIRGLEPDDYELALRQAEAAAEIRQNHVPTTRTVGYALYRSGNHELALETISRVDDETRKVLGSTEPEDLAFLAMAQHHLGMAAEAQQSLQRAQDMLLSDFWAAEDESQEAIAEATALISLPDVDPALAQDLADIKQIACRPQQAGWLRNDVETYMTQWADDAVSINGRGPVEDAYDVVLSRDQIETTRRLRFRGRPLDAKGYSIDDVTVEVDEDTATFSNLVTVPIPTGYIHFRQVMNLRRTNDGWKIEKRRSWVPQRRFADRTEVLNAERLSELDQELAGLLGDTPSPELVQRLVAARRSRDAWEQCCRLTERDEASASDWLLRAKQAFALGDADDMRQAMQKAIDLGGEAEGESWFAAFVEETLGRPPVYKLPFEGEVSVPVTWEPANRGQFGFQGDFIAAWWLGAPKSVLIFRAPTGQPMSAAQIADLQASTQRSLQREVDHKMTMMVEGIELSSVQLHGPGTGGAVTGDGDVPTTQRIVTIPRENDVILVTVTAPTTEFSMVNEQFEAILPTLKFADR